MTRDRFGFQRAYVASDGRDASTIRALLGTDRSLDRVAVDAFLCGEWPTDRTMFSAVHQQLPTGPGAERGTGSLAEQLERAIARAVETAPRPLAVALSGGLDSAVVLALARRMDSTIDALVLETDLPDYSDREVANALRTADELGAGVRTIRVGDFAHPTRQAVGAFEMPLYNLHPLSKWHLASGARRAGIAAVISGDGADQVFRHDTSADYLPLVAAAFDAHGVPLYAPFLEVLGVERDPDKRLLREHAATLGMRDELVHGPKLSRLAPELPFYAPIDRLAQLLDRPIAGDRTRWGTLALLVDIFEAWT